MDATLLIEEIRKIAEELPDFVYDSPIDSCTYDPQEAPGALYGCVVGYAARRLRDSLDNHRADVKTLCDANVIQATPDQRLWLGRVQERQDYGIPWGECVKLADVAYPLTGR